MNFPSSSTPLMVFLAMAWGFAVTLFWMICAWRAMLAHERIAEKLDQLIDISRDKQ